VSSRAVPLLASPDLDATLAFFRGLGFESTGAPHEEWDYLILRRDELELHFVGPTAERQGPGSCFIYVDDADGVFRDWQGSVAAPARIEPPIHTNFGMRAFKLFDPHGNELRVGSAPDGATVSPIRRGGPAR
jgi:catechol 2,3-dioxygenase-like lactoylglutathione lyase family enzyme